jgi:hypothetical protein
MRRSITSTLVFVGLATLSAASEGISFSDLASKFLSTKYLEQTPVVKSTYEVMLDFNTGYAGSFVIGGANNTINLKPQMQLDYTMIAAKNCSECPSHNFDAVKSEEMGFLEPNLETVSV